MFVSLLLLLIIVVNPVRELHSALGVVVKCPLVSVSWQYCSRSKTFEYQRFCRSIALWTIESAVVQKWYKTYFSFHRKNKELHIDNQPVYQRSFSNSFSVKPWGTSLFFVLTFVMLEKIQSFHLTGIHFPPSTLSLPDIEIKVTVSAWHKEAEDKKDNLNGKWNS